MKIIAENTGTYLTEDEDYWIITFKGKSLIKKFLKEEKFFYPIALVQKWGYKIVDSDRLQEIEEEYDMREAAYEVFEPFRMWLNPLKKNAYRPKDRGMRDDAPEEAKEAFKTYIDLLNDARKKYAPKF
ncbi:hypothetical protein PilKf_01743 [Pillotina sp. SPG140]|jgi:hypothetical protein